MDELHFVICAHRSHVGSYGDPRWYDCVPSHLLQSKHEAASALVEAGKCYQKTDQTQAARAFHMAANLYMEMGRISMAAR